MISDRARAAAVGRRVLDALDAGRARAHRQARERRERTERIVRRALDVDIIAGNPERGRAMRIARATGIPRRTVADALARLFYVANSSDHNGPDTTAEVSP
jgi:hypothetical protein